MDIAKINPWNWFKKEDEEEKTLPVMHPRSRHEHQHPLLSLHPEMDRVFERAFKDFGLRSPLFWNSSSEIISDIIKPNVDISGTDSEYVISAELPGMDEKDISIEVKGDTLILKGEKRQEEKTEKEGYYRVERSYGSFRRVLNIPSDADTEGIKAKYSNGVISITLPRTKAVTPETKKIEIEQS